MIISVLGAVAQLGEHLLCKQGVARSNRVSSRNLSAPELSFNTE